MPRDCGSEPELEKRGGTGQGGEGTYSETAFAPQSKTFASPQPLHQGQLPFLPVNASRALTTLWKHFSATPLSFCFTCGETRIKTRASLPSPRTLLGPAGIPPTVGCPRGQETKQTDHVS